MQFPHISASAIVGGGRLSSVLIDFLIMTYLMRQLGPEPFGLIAMVWALIVALSVLKDAGAGESLVSDQAFSAQKVGAATLIAGGLGLLLFLLVLLLEPFVISFYDNEELRMIWLLAGGMAAISCMGSIPQSLAQREEKFGLIAWSPVLGKLIAAALVLWMLTINIDFGYWPILAYSIVSGTVGLLTIWLLVSPHMKYPSLDDLKDILHYSKGVVVFSLLNVLNRNADNIIIGRFLGEQALGLYMLSYRILLYPLKEFGGIVQTIAFPRLAKNASNLKLVGVGLADLMRDVARMTTPFCLGAAVAAPTVIVVIFGEAWMGALVSFQVLALVGVFQAPFAQMGMAYTVSRKTEVMGKWAMWTTPLIIASFFAGLPWGIAGVAIAYACVSVMLIYPMCMVAGKVLGVPPWLLMRGPLQGILYGSLASLPMLCCYFVALAMQSSQVLTLLLVMGVGALTEYLIYRRTMYLRSIENSY
ncbi:MAG: oligosaccharide flippase family protein [Mariprofundaceae bacterium]|nr:oligosaccharide flippase family protein [Mariprofundaceae bacterium]